MVVKGEDLNLLFKEEKLIGVCAHLCGRIEGYSKILFQGKIEWLFFEYPYLKGKILEVLWKQLGPNCYQTNIENRDKRNSQYSCVSHRYEYYTCTNINRSIKKTPRLSDRDDTRMGQSATLPTWLP